MPTAPPATRWSLQGTGYEFCSCQPGCTCNFGGFPSSTDGSCQALVSWRIESGRCGDVDRSARRVPAPPRPTSSARCCLLREQ